MEASQFQQYLEVMKLQIEESVAAAVPKAVDASVNGKIIGMRKELQEYISVDTDWKAKDAEWKTDAQPVIDMGKDVKAGNRIILTLGSIAIAVAAIWGALKVIITTKIKL